MPTLQAGQSATITTSRPGGTVSVDCTSGAIVRVDWIASGGISGSRTVRNAQEEVPSNGQRLPDGARFTLTCQSGTATYADDTPSPVAGDGNVPTVAQVTWIGNGKSAVQQVPLDFDPDALIAHGVSAPLAAAMWHRYTWRGYTPIIGGATPHEHPRAVYVEGGRLYATGNMNDLGVQYFGVALADNGSGAVMCGSYSGNSVAGREIKLGKRPLFVAVKRDNYYNAMSIQSLDSAASPVAAGAQTADVTLSAEGFVVSAADAVNAAQTTTGGGEGYDYIALAECAAIEAIRYRGNGASRLLAPEAVVAAVVKSAAATGPDAIFAAAGLAAPVSAAAGSTTDVSVGGALSVSGGACTAGQTYSAVVLRQSVGTPTGRAAGAGRRALLIGAGGGAIGAVSPSMNFLAGAPFTLELLVRRSATDPGGTYSRAWLTRAQTADYMPYGLFLGTRTKCLEMGHLLSTGMRRYLAIGLSLQGQDIQHIVHTFDGVSEFATYVDGYGRRYNSQATSLVEAATAGSVRMAIGCVRQTGDTRYLSAEGDAFLLARVYSRVLTPDEARRRYLRAAMRDMTAVDVAPVEEWDAANGYGTTLPATISSGNDMTLHAADSFVTL